MGIDLLLQSGQFRIALLLLRLYQLGDIIIQLPEHVVECCTQLSCLIAAGDGHIVMEILLGHIGHFFDQRAQGLRQPFGQEIDQE
ncbi:hypothetical protein D3C81_1958290 [compost metagenome]